MITDAVTVRHRHRSVIPALFAGLPILLVILWGLGALTESTIPGLPVVPWVTLWALPIDLWVGNIAIALTIGFALIGGVLAPRPDSRSGRNASLAALVWLTTLVVQAILSVSEILALSVADSLDTTILWSLLSQTTLGRVMLIQFVVVAFVALLAWVVLGRATGLIVTGGAMFAAFLPGFTGHSGISHGHPAATISLGLHIIAASVWIGGLIAVFSYVQRGAADGAVVLRRFSVLALLSVIVLAETGLVNASLRLYGLPSLVTSTYGALVLAKITVLIVLIGYGWRQRQHLAEVINDGAGGTAALARITIVEVAWMGVALGLSVALVRTAPPAIPLGNEPVTVAALGLVALAIPLALRGFAPAKKWWGSANKLRNYPEAAAVVVVVAMLITVSLTKAGAGNQQLLAAFVIALLLITGSLFWDALAAQRSWLALVIVGLGLIGVTWWNERDLIGGLGAGTLVAVVLLLGVLALGWRSTNKVNA